MKLYRLHTGCEGEYGCDNYLGLFKTTDSMLSFVDDYVKHENRNWINFTEENISVSLKGEQEIFISGVDEIFNDFEYEVIETDNLS